VRTLAVSVIVGVAVLVSACASRQTAAVTTPGDFRMTLVYLGDSPARTPDADIAVVEVSNAYDRSVTVAFEGRMQAEVTVGPSRSGVVRLDPGSYYARGSAPAVPSMPPPGFGMSVEAGKRYRLDVAVLFK
jgi:hypothetical protein